MEIRCVAEACGWGQTQRRKGVKIVWVAGMTYDIDYQGMSQSNKTASIAGTDNKLRSFQNIRTSQYPVTDVEHSANHSGVMIH